MKIMKFGGTSVGKPERMHHIVSLVTAQKEPTIVVLSALSGTTNALVEIIYNIAKGDRATAKQNIDKLEEHYRNFTNDLVKKMLPFKKPILLWPSILNFSTLS